MGIDTSRSTLTTLGVIVPGVAYAQEISPLIAWMALSPILVLLLAVVVGIVSRSWSVGAKHAGLVVLWVVLFGIASYWIENDYIIWTPLVLYAVHALTMLVLVIRGAMRRGRGP